MKIPLDQASFDLCFPIKMFTYFYYDLGFILIIV